MNWPLISMPVADYLSSTCGHRPSIPAKSSNSWTFSILLTVTTAISRAIISFALVFPSLGVAPLVCTCKSCRHIRGVGRFNRKNRQLSLSPSKISANISTPAGEVIKFARARAAPDLFVIRSRIFLLTLLPFFLTKHSINGDTYIYVPHFYE